MSLNQTVAWIEDRETQIWRAENGLHLEATIAASSIALPDSPSDSLHNIDHSTAYFAQVAQALDKADEILIVGPSAIKVEFVKYMHKKDHGFDPRILGVETMEHSDDHELAGYVQRYFKEGGPRRLGQGSGYRDSE